MEKIKISLYNKTVILTLPSFDQDIDVDDLTKIHYDNLSGEIITISTVLNRIGLLRAEVENIVAKNKHLLEVEAAKKRKYYREAGIRSGAKPTGPQVEEKVTLDKDQIDKTQAFLEDQRIYNIVDALYWGVQSKSKKLEVLMKGTTPEEFENDIVEGVINGIMIKKVENLIK